MPSAPGTSLDNELQVPQAKTMEIINSDAPSSSGQMPSPGNAVNSVVPSAQMPSNKFLGQLQRNALPIQSYEIVPPPLIQSQQNQYPNDVPLPSQTIVQQQQQQQPKMYYVVGENDELQPYQLINDNDQIVLSNEGDGAGNSAETISTSSLLYTVLDNQLKMMNLLDYLVKKVDNIQLSSVPPLAALPSVATPATIQSAFKPLDNIEQLTEFEEKLKNVEFKNPLVCTYIIWQL